MKNILIYSTVLIVFTFPSCTFKNKEPVGMELNPLKLFQM